jgi:hypothetical protein
VSKPNITDLFHHSRELQPAHSVKPPIMKELLAYEDEYDALLQDLKRISLEE